MWPSTSQCATGAAIGLTVSITAGSFANDGDVLAASTTGTAITASYDSTNEILTLSGTDKLANYQAVLDTVNFNASEFNVLVQASQFYKFAGTILLAMGLVFQVPVAILAATRMGIVTPRQLRKSRRYAILACAVGRDHYAHAYSVDHAGQEYACDQGISKNSTISLEK